MTHPTEAYGAKGWLAARPRMPIQAFAAAARSAAVRPAAIAAVLALAAALRIYGLARQSAWADEITTLFIADPANPFARFWDLVLSDTHPPLYYLFMRWWFAAFGQSDLAARTPSLIFGILAVGAAALAFRPVRFRARLALMLLIALSPGTIEYAQEARSYSFLLFLATVITGLCFRIVAAPSEGDRVLLHRIAALFAVGIIAAFTHYFGFLIALAAALTAAASLRYRPRPFLAAVIGVAALLATVIPWVFYHAHYMSYGLRMSAWIAGFSAAAMASWFVALWLGGRWALIGLTVAAAAQLSRPSFRTFARRDPTFQIALALPLLTLGAALAISWFTPVITSRNLIVILPALYLGMASLFDHGAVRWGMPFAAVALVVQLLLMVQPLPGYYGVRTKEQWRESAAFLLAQPGCQTGPIYVYGEALNYRYLVEKARPGLRLVEVQEIGTAPPLPTGSDCNVLLWAADLPRAQFDRVLSALPIRRCSLRVATFYWAFVALHDGAGATEKQECGEARVAGIER
ncbi:MAG TPA: glycosyltransferase family 39 protein [Stellaceae bacterium]|nr:glycosyltransferase family 39 protein [Stellaceae bacterium]